MPLQKIEKGERKGYVSYKTDRASLARIIAHERKKNGTYSEGDAIRDALNEKAAALK